MSVFEYLDYRKFLRDFLADKKRQQGRYSLRRFCKLAGFGSSGYLTMILRGTRNLSASSVRQCIQVLELHGKEAEYFENLVFFNQARDEQQHDYYYERLSALKPRPLLTRLETCRLEYFSQKHHVVIREMVGLPEFVEDPAWIAQKMRPPITPTEAEHSIQLLISLHLLKRDGQGKLVQSEPSVTTDPEIFSREVYDFHRDTIGAAKLALLQVPPDLRDFSALTIPINDTALPIVKRKLQEMKEELVEYLNRDDHCHGEVYQINMQCFPMTQIYGKLK